jgi:hypothetical protein
MRLDQLVDRGEKGAWTVEGAESDLGTFGGVAGSVGDEREGSQRGMCGAGEGEGGAAFLFGEGVAEDEEIDGLPGKDMVGLGGVGRGEDLKSVTA